MMVDVHLYDGIVFRCKSRGQMIALLKRDPQLLDEHGPISTWVRWHPESEWEPARACYFRKASIRLVVMVPPAERQAFEAQWPVKPQEPAA